MFPLLFVIGMSTYRGFLQQQGKPRSLNFTRRCSKIQLNHLAFVDDLMLFCKRDNQSIKILTQGVELFPSSSNLFANNTKSGIYLAGVTNEVRDHAASILDFSFEHLPIKYLGMPLTAKRYTVVDCEYLVDKMTVRIRSWIARNLSYTARLQLVNSVLMSISKY